MSVFVLDRLNVTPIQPNYSIKKPRDERYAMILPQNIQVPYLTCSGESNCHNENNNWAPFSHRSSRRTNENEVKQSELTRGVSSHSLSSGVPGGPQIPFPPFARIIPLTTLMATVSQCRYSYKGERVCTGSPRGQQGSVIDSRACESGLEVPHVIGGSWDYEKESTEILLLQPADSAGTQPKSPYPRNLIPHLGAQARNTNRDKRIP
jgi:hypothetical protein